MEFTKYKQHSNITRFSLFILISEEFPKYLKIKPTKDPGFVRKIFYESALLIKNMESNLTSENINDSYEYFVKIFEKNFRDIDGESDLKDIIFTDFANKELSINSTRPRKTFTVLYIKLLRCITSYQNLILSNFINPNVNKQNFNKMNQIFLSYAYKDNGTTLGLFYYFLSRNAFLYIDWMWNPSIPSGKDIKKILSGELAKSAQLLFLRSPYSEIFTIEGVFIRSWCSWEIGNYYVNNSQNKYLINFYNTRKYTNKLLDTFKIMKDVRAGKIIS